MQNIKDKVSQDEFKKMVEQASPNSKLAYNCVKAFVVGGLICALGQMFNNILSNMGASFEQQSMISSIILVFIAALLTGFGLYEKIGKFAGAGSVVPITGFSNSITAPAIEFKKEGFVFGVGAKMFLIAGPVIVYGTLTSVIVGIIYNFIK